MGSSRILNNFIEKKISLEVRALSENSKRPLRLIGFLEDYDSEGYLFQGQQRYGESYDPRNRIFYIPKESLRHIILSNEIIDINNSGQFSEEEYFVEDVKFNLLSRTISSKDKTKVVDGGKYSTDLAKLFKAGIGKTVSYQEFEDLSSEEDMTQERHNRLKTRICGLRKKIKDFGLVINSSVRKGYSLEKINP